MHIVHLICFHIRRIKVEYILVGMFIIGYVILASLVSLNRFWQYNAFWYDFGIFDTTVWKIAHFQLPVISQLSPPEGRVVWGDHFNPTIAFLSPLYWITDRPEIIFIAQAVAVGLSALIAYKITLQLITNKWLRIALIGSYLGFVGLQNALYTDVHNVVFALLPFMLAIWSFYKEKWAFYWLFIFLTMGVQENLSLTIVMLGLFFILRKDRRIQIGIFTIILGLGYGYLTSKIIIPFFNHGIYPYQPVFPRVWYGWLTDLFYPFDLKLKTIVVSFATFGFLPLGAWSTFPLIIEHFLERFVLNNAATRWDLGFHYNAMLSPILFLSSIEFLKELQKKNWFKKLASVIGLAIILLVIFLHRFYLHGPLMLSTYSEFYQQTENAKFLDGLIAAVPSDGLIMTQNNLAASFSHREVFLLTKQYTAIQPDIIVFDLRSGQNPNNFFPLAYEDAQNFAASLSANTIYKKVKLNDSQIIFLHK